jgi:hypothetical protein
VKHLFVAAALLALQSGQMIAADALPEFKAETCRQAEESGSASRNAQNCFHDEETAKDTLKRNWASYDSSQKSHCQRLLKAGGMPSYVELLTCLEMKTVPTTPAANRTKKKGT